MTKRRNLRHQSRSQSRSRSKSLSSRNLHHETLEKRELLAFDLVSVAADVTEQFNLGGVTQLDSPPRELTFRFGGSTGFNATALASFTFTASGGDGNFDSGNETTVTPDFLGLGDTDRIVVARFAGDLPQDSYRVSIPQDTIGLGTTLVDFDLQLGPRVLAVVPQPVTGGVGSRVQATNQIEVFFNDDPLSRVSAGVVSYTAGPGQPPPVLPVVDPANYRLFATKGTVESTDDTEVMITAVSYDPISGKATLTTAGDLSTLAPGETYRLRIGSGQDTNDAPVQSVVSETSTPGDTFAEALSGTGAVSIDFTPGDGLQSHVLVGGEIRNDSSYVLPWPGSYQNPGIRDQRRDAKFTRQSDSTIGTNVYPYNFADLYGRDATGQSLDNAITPAQRQRVREVLDLYEENLGVRFVETADSGLQIVTGDLRGLQQTADVSAGDGTPKSLYRINERDPSRGTLVLDASENFFDSYGLSPDTRPSYFVEAIRGIGSVLGIGDLFELPTGTDGAIGSQDEPNSELFSSDGDGGGNPLGIAGFPATPAEPDFLSHAAKVIGQAVNRPEVDDVDFYAFNVAQSAGLDAGGIVTIETYAQRLGEASLLDSVIRLYRVNGQPGSETFELVARNDDSFGDDSHLRLDLQPGRYVVGVSSTGHEDYYGEKDGDDSATGGRTEGRYDLRITFDSRSQSESTAPTGLTDQFGVPLDGDADGQAGGDFNFWFNAAPNQLNSPRTIFVDPDANGGNGLLQTPFSRIDDALAAAQPGDVVRLLPSLGDDGDLATTDDNVAYNIGRGGPNNAILRDGETFEVPQGVTVMIDAGAILKFSDSKIVAGSESVSEDRSLAAVQVLGTPANNVILTSLSDESVGVDEFPNIITTPQSAQWGGIEFRDDVDLAEGRDVYQNEGIFVNYVSHADIRFGGGRVRPSDPPTAAIKIDDARPTIIYNSITDSAGAAISATPNSFREDTFNSPRYQRFANDVENGLFYAFTSDYDRVGPEIVGNDLQRNSVNGLAVLVSTPTGGSTGELLVSGRFDDTDIAHVITDSLVVAGNPGGATLQEDRPDVNSVTGITRSTGTLAAGTYRYIVTFVTLEGQESLSSVPTRGFTSNGAIELRNLPTAPDGFVGRRIYRGLDTGGTIEYGFVDQIDRSGTRFTDVGAATRGSVQSIVVPSVAGVTLDRAPVDDFGDPVDGVMVAGRGYDYRFTFRDVFGGESQASVATSTVFALQDGAIEIDGIPQPPLRDNSAAIFTGTNVYRRDAVSGNYLLIAELNEGITTLVDTGIQPESDATALNSTLGLDAQRSSKLLPRYDARLTIDPGSVLKFDTSRIEVNFGADFYAEGTPGAPITFTSLNDATAGGRTVVTNALPTAGDWGGISIRQSSTASLDYADIRFGGGSAVLEGQLRDSNALEILQADVRVTNSRFTDNADGFRDEAAANETRLGRGFNAPATIFVRGSQPIIVDNVIDRGEGAAISINPDSFTPDANIDHGRSTGLVDLYTQELDNQGPLIAGNQIAGHGINGLDIRSEIVTVDSTWDDTDITHVVRAPIHSLTNAYGGALRLRSDSDASLVVKFGPDGTLNADGRPLDIDDRIGGTLQILGSPGFPVVLTSLNDDTIGGGFTPDGIPNVDTVGPETLDIDGNPITPAPGDWIGVRIGTFANDRNVAYRYENELPIAADESTNDRPDDAQALGILAARENASDENQRLGFNVRGLLSAPSDVDVYSFTASGGTEVIFDIDETSSGLDTVLELVTVDGRIIASSDNSRAESVGTESLFVDETLPEGVLDEDVRPTVTTITSTNVESPNLADAGFKVRLPGSSLADLDYYIRVRTADGITSGQYTLSLRLQDGNEIAGSNIRRAEIRYATTAIDVVAAPLHSPLAGDVGEIVDVIDPTPGDRNSGDESTREVVDLRLNQNFAGAAQPIGNLLTSDRGSLVVTGEIGNLNDSLSVPALFNSLLDERLEDVDIYRVDLFAQQLEPDTFDSENRFVTTTFDIDYADQLGRPDTRLSIYDAQGRLILVGHDSNVTDDSARPVEGVDSTNLSGGSSGISDAYIGPVELPEGTYFVAVSSAATVPQFLDQFFDETPTNPLVRLMPINSTRTISRDSFEELTFEGIPGSTIGFADQFLDYTAEAAYIVPNFDVNSAVPYSLDDITLFVSYSNGIPGNGGNDVKSLAAFNPFTGTMTRLIGESQQPVGDIAIRRDGALFSYTLGPNNGQQNSGNTGNFQRISSTDADVLGSSEDGIVFQQSNEAGTGNEVSGGAQLLIQGMAFVPNLGTALIPTNNIPAQERLFVVGTRDNTGRGGEIPVSLTRNILYLAAANDGEITSFGSLDGDDDRDFGNVPYNTSFGPASDEEELGVVDTGQIDTQLGGDGGDLTGVAVRVSDEVVFDNELVAVTNLGGVHVINPSVTQPAPIGGPEEGYNRVIPTDFYGLLEPTPDHVARNGSTFLQFSGLTYAPQSIEEGRYDDTYFATTSDGWLYAFTLDNNEVTGEFDVVPAPVFFDGNYGVELSFVSDFGFTSPVGNVTNGLAFSTLQINPFQINGERFADPGHGLVTPYDRSRQPLGLGGGNSLYFGFSTAGGTDDNTLGSPETGRQLSPGGLQGSTISDSIDLSNYSAGDRPTLYFTYFIEVEADDDFDPIGGDAQPQRDSFRVFGSGEDGQYRLLATNNEFRNVAFDDEFDEFNRALTRDLDNDPGFEAGIPVQEIFDDIPNGQWRQARVDLSPFAGDRDVKIRFDFSSAGARLDQIGSVELVARDAVVIPDNDIALLTNDRDQGAALQTIVGSDIVFAPGVNYNAGDSLIITGADGELTTVLFVDSLGGAVAAGTVPVLIDPAASANDVARAVGAAVPSSLAPTIDGNGRLSLLRAVNVSVDEAIAAGLATPQPFADPGSPLLITPNAQAAVDGETFTVDLFGFGGFGVETFTYRRLGNETGDTNEIIFDDTITDPIISDVSVATEASRVINSVFGAQGFGLVSFVVGGDVQFNSLDVQLSVTAGPTVLARRTVDDPRVRVEFSEGIVTNDDETVQLTDAFGDTFVIVLNDDNNIPGNIIPAGATVIDVAFANGDTVEQIRDAVVAAVTTAAPSLDAAAALDEFGLPTAVTFDASVFAQTQRPNPFFSVAADAVRFDFPTANQIIDGETITIETPTGTVEILFNAANGPSDVGTVVFRNNSVPGNVVTSVRAIVDDFIDVALEGNFEIGRDGGSLIFYGIDVTNVTFSEENTNFEIFDVQARRINVPSGNELNDRDTIEVTATPPTSDSANEDLITFVDEGANPAADEIGEIGFERLDSAEDIRDDLDAIYRFAFQATGQAGQVQLLIAGDELNTTSPDPAVTTLRFEPFIEIDLPTITETGRGLRTGETIDLSLPTGEALTLVFVRTGSTFNVPAGQLAIPFDETSTAIDVGRDIAQRVNQIDPAFVAVGTLTGFGLAVDGADAVLSFDPQATQIDVSDESFTYSVPITVPRGELINEGETLTIFRRDRPFEQVGEVYTFTTDPVAAAAGVNQILFAPSESASVIAERLLGQLAGDLRSQFADGSDRVLLLSNASSVIVGNSGSTPPIVSFQAAENTTLEPGDFFDDARVIRATPVLINQSQDSTEVAEALQIGLADALGPLANDPTPEPGFFVPTEPSRRAATSASAINYKIEAGDRVRLFNSQVVDAGRYGLNTFLPGDNFGVSLPDAFTNNQVSTVAASGNQFEGVYIDDIIVGFAERGEAVIYDNFLGSAANANFVLNPEYTPDSRGSGLQRVAGNTDQPENPDQILVGQYSLEIRTADNYGVPQDFDPINLVLDESTGSGRTFDTNDRLRDGGVTMIVPAGINLIDGDRFTIDDGTRSLTFEFNNTLVDPESSDTSVDPSNVPINFEPSDTDFDIAGKIRDAINNEQFTSSDGEQANEGGLRVRALSGDGAEVGVTSSNRVELIGENIVVNPTFAARSNGQTGDVGRTIKIDGVATETPFGDFTNRRFPVVDQDLRTVAYLQINNESAALTDYVPGDTLVVDGKIGDRVSKGIQNNTAADDGSIVVSDPQQDLDIYRIYLTAGSSIDLDVDTTGLFRDTSRLVAPVIAVLRAGTPFSNSLEFDQNLIGFSDFANIESGNGESAGGAFATAVADVDGYYDVVISSRFAYDGGFFAQNPDFDFNEPFDDDNPFTDPADAGFGEYQLTIRPTASVAPGASQSSTGVPSRDVLFVDYQFGKTDVNRVDDQGQILIESNIIRDSLDFAIDASIGARGQTATSPVTVDGLTRPGSAALLRNINSSALVTGTVIVNNLIIDSTITDGTADDASATAIRFAGGTFADGDVPSPNVFGRILNNTIIGDGDGTAIDIAGRAAPAILNNVIVGTALGVNVDTVTANQTVSASNVFAAIVTTPSNVTEDQSIILPTADNLFSTATNGDQPIFVPAAGSVLVDSSLETLRDRLDFVDSVKGPVNIAPSPVLAPTFDALGNRRIDSPGVGAGGTGGNVFVDRGALEQSDTRRPTARLSSPLDAVGSANLSGDNEPAPAVVRLGSPQPLPFIEVELSDVGIGIALDTVTPSAVTLLENGTPLVRGRDYTFAFSPAGTTIRLTSTRGEFRGDATYEVLLSQTIRDLAGNAIAPTNDQNETLLTIITAGVEVDFGDAPASYGTSSSDGGPVHSLPANASVRLGSRLDTEAAGIPSAMADSDDNVAAIAVNVASAPSLTSSLVGGQTLITVSAVPAVGEVVFMSLDGRGFVVQFSDPTQNIGIGRVAINVDGSSTVESVTADLSSALESFLTANQSGVAVAAAPATDTVALESFDDEDGVQIGRINRTGRDYFVFGTPQADGVVSAADVDGILVPGTTTAINVVATGDGFLDAWIDFDGDGSFDEQDRIAASIPVTTGNNIISVTTPAGLTTPIDTFARFRVSETGGLLPTGFALGGEVEDYQISIAPTDFGLPFNTPPSFTMTGTSIELREGDTSDVQTITNFLTNLLPGNPNKVVELQSQTVASVNISSIGGTPGLLIPGSLQIVTPGTGGDLTADLQYATVPDGNGVITFTLTATDNVGLTSAPITVTLNVRPQNDAPRIKDPLGVPAADQRNADDAYSVAANGEIAYTLKEDNTELLGVVGDPFFIPFTTGTSVGYNRIGLLSVFEAGAADELDPSNPTGNQVLNFVEAFSDRGVGITALGGTLTPRMEAGVLVGLDYVPPTDLNTNFGSGGIDSFFYTVLDDNPSGGESFDPDLGIIIPQPLTSTNRVELRLNPVNDRPVFDTTTLELSVQEDAQLTEIEAYASGIFAGPVRTAFDEVSSTTGQSLEFTLVSLDFPQADADDFFEVYPEIDESTGLLAFQPAANIFGDFRFEVTLNDDGPENSTRGDLISSVPVTLTIGVRPTNDPPQVAPGADPLVFEIDEDNQAVILVNGTATEDGLLDVFRPGPSVGRTDEAADIAPAPGGNQTVALRTPITNRSTEGGTIEFDDSGATPQLIYTPRPNFVGTDTFIYSVFDDGQSVDADGVAFTDSRIASNTVTIVVAPVNDAPLFSGGDNVTTPEQSLVTDVSIPNWASIVQAGPPTAIDEINGTINAPAQGLEFVFNQVSGDTGLFATPVTAPIDAATGTASLTFQQIPQANGVAVFEVFLQDDGPGSETGANDPTGDKFRSEPAGTFTITVESVNDPPQATIVNPTVVVDEDEGPISVQQFDPFSPGPAEATDEQSQTVSFEVQPLAPVFADLFSVQPTVDESGFLRFTTAPNANSFITGPIPIVVTARDSGGTDNGGNDASTFTFNIVITEVNDSPRARLDEFSTDEDTPLTLTVADLIANDTDPDTLTNPGETLSLNLQPEFTSASGARVRYDAATGTITYDPTDRFASPTLQALMNDGVTAESLTDSFTYSLIDSTGLVSNVARVAIDVSGINDAPILVPDTPTLNSDGTTIITPLENDFDIDGTIDATSIEITLLPAFGSLDVLDDGTIIYTPFNDSDADDVFRYTVADNFGLRSEEALVTISANASPIAVSDNETTFINESVFIDVAENDSDPNGSLDLDSITIVRTPLFGEAMAQPDGTVQYIPDAGFVGIDTFEYRIADDQGRLSNVATTRVQVVASRMQNPDRFSDVNADGLITAIDALLIVNFIGREGTNLAVNDAITRIPDELRRFRFLDVSGDQVVSVRDALDVINELERINNVSQNSFGAEREQVFASGIDVGTESRLASGSVTSVANDPINNQVAEKLVDVSDSSSEYDDIIDSIVIDSSSSDSDSETSAIDEVLTGLF
ncbi:hypothetical protein LF1_03170 [Rubripirellula obstinata]|uniref:Uncharacterized protein n=1 Tax=Rubripirellula obstinata TaxID=406547 RepID=A0A5B1C9K9_9BACT|nr:tandem-95 repeat protein [Rubripirellula obstinata]KAA1257827.1 hypothetical protein LF1_03170 [Rubripirellula obstinata]